MNPNLFPVDYQTLGEIITFVTILAFMVERSLAFLFEFDFYEKYDKKAPAAKEIIAFLFSYLICKWGGFDAFAQLMKLDTGILSQVLTALLVAGGSKGAIKLMQGYLGISKKIIRVNKQTNLNVEKNKAKAA